ncbi:MAG: hypothetical protein DHS20C18_05350 [Saprospiraceae bacterium]|nr:MAG: hypothetical protein DHS20C18_05350 [Saprospiraceae bacterium]
MAAGHFTYTPLACATYEQILSLRFDKARQQLSQLRQEDPNNLVVYHLENYLDFFTIYIQEDEDVYERLKDREEEHLSQIRKGDSESPYYLFIQADIRLHWALLRIRYEEYFNAFLSVNKAFKLLEKNQRKFPDFLPNLKDLGILHAAVGTIPESYLWGVKLVSSLNGTIDQGRREIETVLAKAESSEFIFEAETRVLYAFILLHLDDAPEEAWMSIQSARFKPRENPLHCFVVANIAMRTGRNDKAVELLQNRPKSKDFFVFPYLDYMLGLSKLRRLDQDAAPHFERYLERFKGRHFIKEAYQKLAWAALIKGNVTAYNKYMQACLKNGFAVAGGDKNALKEAEESHVPPIALVKARLLFDGAYFQRAYDLLSSTSVNTFNKKRDQLEYTYRLGRILHGLKRYPEAIQYYEQTIREGKDETYFFACNAALQIGKIYETTGDEEQARQYYENCLNIRPDEYRTGLHQQAKAGLARLRNQQ